MAVIVTSESILEVRMYHFGKQALILLLQKGRIVKIFNSLPSITFPMKATAKILTDFSTAESGFRCCRALAISMQRTSEFFELGKNIFNLDYI